MAIKNAIFNSYLDAWLYARKHGLNKTPVKISFREWKLV